MTFDNFNKNLHPINVSIHRKFDQSRFIDDICARKKKAKIP